MSRYVLTPDAETDLKEIRGWYRTERGHEAARRVLQDLRATIRRLARNRASVTPVSTCCLPNSSSGVEGLCRAGCEVDYVAEFDPGIIGDAVMRFG